jgi:hypothetical protein
VVKVLDLESRDALKAHELLVREAAVLRRLDHPRIPKLLDFFTEDEGPRTRVCLVQQHVDGRSLLDRVRAEGPLGEAEALGLGAKLARVLEHLHGFEPPILHRDVKPANVLVTAGRRVWLVDFGAVRDHVTREVFHAGGPTVVGSPGYMPLEQFEGRAVPGSDLYALGATLVFALSGKEPAALGSEGLRLHVEAHLAVSPGCRRLLARLLEPDWRDRPLRASEVREDLERLAAEAKRPAPAGGRRTAPRLVAGIAALAVVAALLLVVRVLPRPRPEASPPEVSVRLPAEAPPPGHPALLAEATPAPAPAAHAVPPTSAAPKPSPPEPLPSGALPPGQDVTSQVSVEERPAFTAYRFDGPLGQAQTLDVDVGLGAVWVGTSRGLVRHDLRTGRFELWGAAAGLPGERLDEIAVVGGLVIADSATPSGPHSVRGTGVLALDTAGLSWSTVGGPGSVWDLWGDGSTLWAGTGQGALVRDLETGAERRFTQAAGELVHDVVHAVRRHGATVAFASLGDWVKEKEDFEGGGLTLWDRGTGRFRTWTGRDGLARGYSCDVFLDDADVFVAHWDEERGLSRVDRRTGQVDVLRRSANGVDLGGVVLAGDAETLWVGQQGALVRLDRATRQATALREADGLPGYIVSGIRVAEDVVWASVYAYGRDGVRAAGLVRVPRR